MNIANCYQSLLFAILQWFHLHTTCVLSITIVDSRQISQVIHFASGQLNITFIPTVQLPSMSNKREFDDRDGSRTPTYLLHRPTDSSKRQFSFTAPVFTAFCLSHPKEWPSRCEKPLLVSLCLVTTISCLIVSKCDSNWKNSNNSSVDKLSFRSSWKDKKQWHNAVLHLIHPPRTATLNFAFDVEPWVFPSISLAKVLLEELLSADDEDRTRLVTKARRRSLETVRCCTWIHLCFTVSAVLLNSDMLCSCPAFFDFPQIKILEHGSIPQQ